MLALVEKGESGHLLLARAHKACVLERCGLGSKVFHPLTHSTCLVEALILGTVTCPHRARPPPHQWQLHRVAPHQQQHHRFSAFCSWGGQCTASHHGLPDV